MSELNKRITDVAEELLECKTEVGRELERGSIEMDRLNRKIDVVQDNLNSIIVDMSDLLTIFRASEGFFKVMATFGQFVKWLAIIGISATAIIHFAKTGNWK